MSYSTNKWFHNVTGQEAETLLLTKGVHGSFLARPSTTQPNTYTLSVRRQNTVTHINIRNEGGQFDLHGGEKFATLSDLVNFYRQNPEQMKERERGEMIDLLSPLLVENMTNERWFHGPISGKEAERMLLQRNVQGMFLVRESAHKRGSYVISVLTCRNAVSHVLIHRRADDKLDVGGGRRFDTLVDLINFYNNTPMVEKSGQLVSLKVPYKATRMIASMIAERMEQLSRFVDAEGQKNGFFEEYEELQNEPDFPCEEGSRPCNFEKNRFKNVRPFDHSRVVLRPIANSLFLPPPGSDYINANYIRYPYEVPLLSASGASRLHSAAQAGSSSAAPPPPGSTAAFSSQLYIATQGTIEKTLGDFWRMVWQENSRVIVMVTKELERTRNMCIRYWPSVQEGTREFSCLPHANCSFEVTLVWESPESSVAATGFIGRQFSIRRLVHDAVPPPHTHTHTHTHSHTHSQDAAADAAAPITASQNAAGQSGGAAGEEEETRFIYHYQFEAWPDHGVPSEPGQLLNLMALINDKQNVHAQCGPIICHCSAGSGRSGTFITIDIMRQLLRHNSIDCEIDIQHVIACLRRQRLGMVQTVTQYRFIYQAVKHDVHTLMAIKREARNANKEYCNLNINNDVTGFCGASTNQQANQQQLASSSANQRGVQPAPPHPQHQTGSASRNARFVTQRGASPSIIH